MADKQQVYTVTVKVIGDQELRALQQQVRGLDTVTKKLGGGATAVKASGNAFKNMGHQVTNASYQLSDFIVQVTNGQDAMRAFGQQAPQLLGAFGAVGAVVGVVASLMPVVVQAFTGTNQTVGETKEALSDLADEFLRFNQLAGSQSETNDVIVDLFGAISAEAEIIYDRMQRLEQGSLLAGFTQQTNELADAWQDLDGIGNRFSEIQSNFFDDRPMESMINRFGEFQQGVRLSITEVSRLVDRMDEVSDEQRYADISRILEIIEQTGVPFRDMSEEAREAIALLNAWQRSYVVAFVETPAQVPDEVKMPFDAEELQRQIDSLKQQAVAIYNGADATKVAEQAQIAYNRRMIEADLIEKGYQDLIPQRLALYDELIRSQLAVTNATKEQNEAAKAAAEQYQRIETVLGGNLKSAFASIINQSKSAKDAFNDMARSIVNDIANMIIKIKVIDPLIRSLNVSLGGSAKGGIPDKVTAALGGLVGGVKTPMDHFATGGIISNLGSYRGALVGESGPEAIMPLRRTPSGRLGVESAGGNTTVNVINNTNADASVTETETPGGGRQIDVVIENVVQRGFARGAFDTTLRGAYGLQRRGQGGR